MNILVQFPTFARPDKFLKVLEQYVDMSGADNELFFNINCDSADLTMTNMFTQETIVNILSKKENVSGSLHFDSNTEKISAINDHVDTTEFAWDILVCASDDMVPRIEGWDYEISLAMEEYYPDMDGCVHFNDGNTNGNLITFSILGRKLYEHFGYVYHPDYKSLYCDDEFTQVVRAMGKETYIDKVIVSHEHYSIEGSENEKDFDLAARKTLHYSGRDQKVFEKRKELGFPKERITND